MFNKTPVRPGMDGTLRLGTKNDSITFLGSLMERSPIPSVWNKMEYSFWGEDDDDKNIRERFPTFHEYFGKPKFKPVDHLRNEQLPGELDKLLEIMKQKDIIIQTFTEVPPRLLYRFITKELFPSLTTGEPIFKPVKLIYEEFHSNDEYQIRKATSEVLRGLLEWSYSDWMSRSLKPSLKNYKELKYFLNSYKSMGIDFMEMDEIAIQSNSASIIFMIGFYGITDQVFVHHFEGDGQCELVRSGKEWRVTYVQLPKRIR